MYWHLAESAPSPTASPLLAQADKGSYRTTVPTGPTFLFRSHLAMDDGEKGLVPAQYCQVYIYLFLVLQPCFLYQ